MQRQGRRSRAHALTRIREIHSGFETLVNDLFRRVGGALDCDLYRIALFSSEGAQDVIDRLGSVDGSNTDFYPRVVL